MGSYIVKIKEHFTGMDKEMIIGALSYLKCIQCGKPITVNSYTEGSFFYLSDPHCWCSLRCLNKRS